MPGRTQGAVDSLARQRAAELFVDTSAKTSGALPFADSGQGLTPFSGLGNTGMFVVSGIAPDGSNALSRVRPTTTPKSAYLQAKLQGKITRIGGRFFFPAWTGDSLQGSVNMLCPQDDYGQSWIDSGGVSGFLPPLGLHWTTSPSFTDLNVFESVGGASATPVSPSLFGEYYDAISKYTAPIGSPTYTAGSHLELLEPDLLYDVDIFRIDDTRLVYDLVRVVDGVSMLAGVVEIEDDRVSSYMGQWAIWENFINASGGDYSAGPLGGWTHLWADSSVEAARDLGSSRRYAAAKAEQARSIAVTQLTPGVADYQTSDATNVSVPAPSLAVAQATNLVKNGTAVGNGSTPATLTVPVTPPASGKVLVEGTGLLDFLSYIGADVYWALKSGASTVAFRKVASVPTMNRWAVWSGLVVTKNTGALTVDVTTGEIVKSDDTFISIGATSALALAAAPSSNPRVDLIQANYSTGAVSKKDGTPAASPVAPSADANCIALATVPVSVGATEPGTPTDVRPRPGGRWKGSKRAEFAAVITGLTPANGYTTDATYNFEFWHSASVASAAILRLASSINTGVTFKVTPLP